MIIDEREEYSDNSVAGTRNISLFDDAAPPSDMVLFSHTETREAQEERWTKTADLVENIEQHNSLKNASATNIWNKSGSFGDVEYIALPSTSHSL
jgi:hypothetical protein